MKEAKFTKKLSLTINVCNYGDTVAGMTGQDYQCKKKHWLCPRWIIFGSLFIRLLFKADRLKCHMFPQPPFMFCYCGPFEEIYYRISNLRG
jgi:hypothetical protein